MAQKTSITKRLANSIVSALGYFPITKSEAEWAWFKSVSLSLTQRGLWSLSLEHLQKNGLRKPSSVSFEVLRQLAKHDPVVRICVNVIKKSISQSKWHIGVHKNAPKGKWGYKKEQQKAIELFEFWNMNGENLRIILDRVLEDLLVLDAGAIEKLYSLDGTVLLGINSVDGATIRPVFNEYGELGSPAYKQFIQSRHVADFEQDELVYMMANPQNDVNTFWYGLSPIESILMQVQASLEADMYNIKHFSKDNIPPWILNLGEMNDEEAENFIALWNATVIGNTHGMKFVWWPSNNIGYTPFNTSNKDMQYSEYIDWLTRIKLAAYGLTGIDANILHDVNRANAQTQMQISNSRWVAWYKQLVEEYFTSKVISALGEEYKWLEFRFDEHVSLESRKKLAEIHAIYVQNGVLSENEVREELGYSELDHPLTTENMQDGWLDDNMSTHDEDRHWTDDPNDK